MSITPMIYLDGRGVTRDEVLRVAQQAATGFEQLGVSEGDTVALLLRNDFAFFEVQQAAAAVGQRHDVVTRAGQSAKSSTGVSNNRLSAWI